MTEGGYYIEDPRPIAADAPYTFFRPSAEELAAIRPSDLVKILFQYTHEIETWAAERIWVEVQQVDADHLSGTLANQPDEPTSPLALGDTIAFERYHVLGIVWDKPEEAPPEPAYREYWERCLVDNCVLDGQEPVEYLYREEPDMAQEDDKFPDSGWRIRGRQSNATDADMEGRKFSYVALGAVLNRDDSWLPFIDEPVGSAFMRNIETGIYLPAE